MEVRRADRGGSVPMHVSLKPKRLRRYKDVARLLWRHGRSDLVRSAGLEDALSDEALPSDGAVAEAEELVRDIEKMGPTFIKLGQILSTRTELLPVAYIDALSRLQDRVEPVPVDDAIAVVESELGRPLTSAFREFDREPLAAASLGQVHRAVLEDGTPVAVKVQRPGIREQIAEDLAALSDVAEFLDEHTEMGRRLGCRALLTEFRRALVYELDYRQEARNLDVIATNLDEFSHIVVPRPFDDYTTGRVLTMEYVDGTRLEPLGDGNGKADRVGARRRALLAEELFRAYLKQVLVDGIFHADPHPGNLLLTPDGRLALVDLGMVSSVSPAMRDRLLRWLMAIAEGRGEEAANIALKIGRPRPGMDRVEFRRRVTEIMSRNGGGHLRDVEVGKIVVEATRIADECGLAGPIELTMLGKALLHLDHVGKVLDPEFDANASVRRNAAEIVQQRMLDSISGESLMRNLYEISHIAGHLPARVNRILDTVANNELQVHVEAIDEQRLIAGLHKIANRITLGLILAALVIAASLLMRVPTTFNLFGYPGIAIVLFLVAAGGGLVLALSIVITDRRPSRNE
jgi:predicted unusual protein kinase regulating ubiquinone biosynthesis (AarF/ABC1/UbiB family)